MQVPIQLHPIIFCILVLCSIVYLCYFEGCLEYITLGIFVQIVHFDLVCVSKRAEVSGTILVTLPCSGPHLYLFADTRRSSVLSVYNICLITLNHWLEVIYVIYIACAICMLESKLINYVNLCISTNIVSNFETCTYTGIVSRPFSVLQNFIHTCNTETFLYLYCQK